MEKVFLSKEFIEDDLLLCYNKLMTCRMKKELE